MMSGFICNDGCHGCVGGRVFAQGHQLLMQMFQYNSLDCYCCCSNCAWAAKSGQQSQEEATDPAQMEAPAARAIAALELCPEDTPMTFFMELEFPQFRQHGLGSEPRCQDLPLVDVDCTVLACVVDLQHTVAVIGHSYDSRHFSAR